MKINLSKGISRKTYLSWRTLFLSDATPELLWLQTLLAYIVASQQSNRFVYCDKQRPIHIIHNYFFHEHTNHIEHDCHFIHRNLINKLFTYGLYLPLISCLTFSLNLTRNIALCEFANSNVLFITKSSLKGCYIHEYISWSDGQYWALPYHIISN